jgi:hypothetical protein
MFVLVLGRLFHYQNGLSLFAYDCDAVQGNASLFRASRIIDKFECFLGLVIRFAISEAITEQLVSDREKGLP